ncbi:hydrogenase small subunit [Oryzomonas japonica]|uniref:Ni/Fe hydrogenase n=2 Tax=Oryzomonas TaxID=2855184 RepID=A0A5A9XHJ9_9BACT|nr:MULTISPECIES: hydrogenase small subunit [Oryzomonas]KAA0892280.1 Ni/Fe hydrogenase [Oryzomonas rubra]KAB0665327.1 hydrogenase small subunit [Oryzomonas japonica]
MTKEGLFPGVTRRDFMKTCMTVSAMLGLPYGMVTKVAQAAQKSDNRPAVIWLHFQECTGCSESLLRSTHPTVSNLILDMISLDYHETLMVGSGHQAEKSLTDSLLANKGKYILVVEGAIPTKDNGIYCKVHGKTALDSLKHAAEGAAAIISMGTCASYGGIQSVGPNPTGAVGVRDIVKDKPIINIPGCPPNPYNFLSTVLYYVTFKKLPELDQMGRPKFAFGRRIHEHCERRPHFDAGRFARAFGDEGHSQGYCLYKLGCKGPATYANCSVLRFNDVGAWPVSIGHPCIGCTEPDLLFKTAIADKVQIHEPTPFDSYAPIDLKEKGKGPDPLTTGVIGLAAGAAIGAGVMMAKKLPDGPEKGDDHGKTE